MNVFCLFFLFVEYAHNIPSVLGLSIKKRTELLLSKSLDLRSWTHLLSEQVLASTRLVDKITLGNYLSKAYPDLKFISKL